MDSILMKKLILNISLIILFAYLPKSYPSTDPLPEARGVWITRDVLASAEQIEQAFYKLVQANFNCVFINAMSRGGTVYPSAVMKNAGGPEQLPEFVGKDPLKDAIEIGHRWGLEVIAWMEYGLMVYWSDTDTSNSGPIIARHPDWEAISRDGAHWVKNQFGVFHWLDPAHPDVIQFMEDLFGEMAEHYPQLDGIETDRIRYPSNDFSYSAISRSRYMQETGNLDPLTINSSHPQWQQWIAWREQQTTHIARRIYQRAKQINPRLLFSAAVVPPYMLVVHEKLQRWDTWADSGYVDILEPMLYVNDVDLPNQLAEAMKCVPQNFDIYPGIAYQSDASIQNQIRQVRQKGLEGMTLWYYGDLKGQTLDLLKANLFTESTSLPHNDIVIDNSSTAQFETMGNWMLQNGGFKGNYLIADPGDGTMIATWKLKILKSGIYSIFARWIADPANATDAPYHIHIGKDIETKTMDQRQDGDRWILLTRDTLDYRYPVVIQLSNSANAKVIADAVRLRLETKFELYDWNVPDSIHLELKFSHNLDQHSAEDVSNFKISGEVAVLQSELDRIDAKILKLLTSPMTAEQTYTLTINGLSNEFGDNLPETQIDFQFSRQTSALIIDNVDPNFKSYGNWTGSSEGSGYIGEDYLISHPGNGENRTQWWHPIEQDGNYEIAVRLPKINQTLAAEAPYSILHNFGTDTMRVDQQNNSGDWKELGVFFYRSGKVASVQVSNKVNAGMVVADAIRIRRTLQITEVKDEASMPFSYRLYQNYPNPFNSGTMIKFEIAKAGRVSLKVFNLMGQEIKRLVDNKNLLAEQYCFSFNSKDLPSGIYFYQWKYLPINDEKKIYVQTKKMLIIH